MRLPNTSPRNPCNTAAIELLRHIIMSLSQKNAIRVLQESAVKQQSARPSSSSSCWYTTRNRSTSHQAVKNCCSGNRSRDSSRLEQLWLTVARVARLVVPAVAVIPPVFAIVMITYHHVHRNANTLNGAATITSREVLDHSGRHSYRRIPAISTSFACQA